jgi:uncharacterized protein (DUF1800 family)
MRRNPRDRNARNPLRPLPPEEFDDWKALHLLNRAGFGGTPQQVRALARMGLNAAVDHLVEYERIASPPVTADLFDHDVVRPANDEERAEVARARQRGDEALLERFRREVQRRQQADRRQMGAIQEWWLTRMIESPRPLEEKMTLFWHGHFATNYRGTQDSYHMFLQNQLFRAHATGSFADLVFGIIRDPAMLRYLNNDQNRRRAPNENLARELMELFTMGEGSGYTEQDVKEGARALTGYSFDDDDFIFRRAAHDEGVKRIFGQSARFDGDDLVRLILNQPIVSEFISLKLYRCFVNDLPGGAPPQAQRYVLAMAKRLRDSNYALRPVLKAVFRSAHFYDELNLAAMIKNPVQLIVQAVRSMHAPVRNLRVLLEAAAAMGQSIFYPPSVKGWDGGRAWINTSTLFTRQNTLVYLLTGRRPRAEPWWSEGPHFDAMHMTEPARDMSGRLEPDAAVRYLLRFMLGSEPHPERIRALTAYVHAQEQGLDNTTLIRMLALITAMPEYQLH